MFREKSPKLGSRVREARPAHRRAKGSSQCPGLAPRRSVSDDGSRRLSPSITSLRSASALTPGEAGFTLAQNVRKRTDVDRALARAGSAGAKIKKPAQDTFWGGRSGYFSDPDGYLWEIAWNPHFPLDREGRVQLPE
ncbi:VOC family protein [bacterium]|nr:VOC family protein [bacterium]